MSAIGALWTGPGRERGHATYFPIMTRFSLVAVEPGADVNRQFINPQCGRPAPPTLPPLLTYHHQPNHHFPVIIGFNPPPDSLSWPPVAYFLMLHLCILMPLPEEKLSLQLT